MRHSTVSAPYAALTPVAGGLAFACTYDESLLAHFKTKIPAHARKWDANNKVWIVAEQYGAVCAELADTYLGVTVDVPQQTRLAAQKETRLIKLEYLGRCKDRGGDVSAMGYANGDWSLVFPEVVLRNYFEAAPPKPGEKSTLFATLGIKPSATIEEIRSAYRRLARQWHPDVCREPDAAQQFKIIQGAYEILSDPLKRKKYDMGLQFEASMKNQAKINDRWNPVYGALDANGYRSPLRCGWLLVVGTEALGRLVVEKILEWQDIVRADGATLVTSWPMGAKTFQTSWV